jgi:hypothetical protein
VCLARRRSAQWGCGGSVIVVAAISVIVVPEWQHHYSPVWLGAAIVTAVAGVLVMALAPRAKWDRLFWYPGGIAQRLTSEPEPKILRWADATAVRVGFYEDEDSLHLNECVVDGPDGLSITVDYGYKQGRDKLRAFAQEAERAMTARLLPGLADTYRRGEPIVFGELTISQQGLSFRPAQAARLGQPTRADSGPWQLAWPDIRLVRAHGPGRGVKVHLRPRIRGNHWVSLEGVPNGLIAHRVIEQAAAWFRIPVEVKEE